MRRRILLVAVLLAVGTTSAASARGNSCIPQSWVGGSAWLCAGTLVYTDYVDDDFGADTGAFDSTNRTASLAPSAGDQTYPSGHDDGTGDLIRLTLRPRGNKLVITGLLNALYEPGQTTLAVAIDTDHNQRTGGGKWGALDVSSRGWDEIAYLRHGDPATNTVSGTMPLPAGAHWRVQAVTAIRSTGQVMNVAFRGTAEKASAGTNETSSDSGAWFEDEQAAALSSGDISQFGVNLNRAEVLRGASKPLTHVRTGILHERVYRSAFTVPPQNEGVSETGVPGRGDGGSPTRLGFEQSYQYLGHYQPYGIYIPSGGSGQYGMQMVFHGSSASLSSLINQPGIQQQFGQKLHRILVTPEARGNEGWDADYSERDHMDVMSDVERSYNIDRNKVYSGGYSQGGYIAYRIAELFPDRFAGLVDWVGFTGDDDNGTPQKGTIDYTAGAVGNAVDFVGNLRRVPSDMLYSGADELVHVWTGEAMDNAFKATDDIYRFYMHPAAEHLTYALLDNWQKEAADSKGWTLVHNPPRVTYTTAPFLDSVPARLGIFHDHAYWVSGIRPGAGAPPTKYETVDLTTHACGGTQPASVTNTRTGTDPVPWVSDERDQTGLKALPKSYRLTGTLTNVSALRIAASAACLAGHTFDYDITTDGPATLTLSDGRTLSFSGAGEHQGTLGFGRHYTGAG
ncbi:MAG: prolyl oligopeptidase family serine peptidase [Solirubrobacteraceae bacterium]